MTSFAYEFVYRTRRSESVEVTFDCCTRGVGRLKALFAVLWQQIVTEGLGLSQLFALLVVRKSFCTDHEGVVMLLGEWTELQKILGLNKTLDHSTFFPCRAVASQKEGLKNFFRLAATEGELAS